MEGNTHMSDFSLLLQLECRFISSALPEFFKYITVLGMHQIEVKVINTARIKLCLKEGTDILFPVEIASCQLIRQDIFLTGIP